ncbi:hypothetical protein ACQJBY_069743 [Aegilops geniculata]
MVAAGFYPSNLLGRLPNKAAAITKSQDEGQEALHHHQNPRRSGPSPSTTSSSRCCSWNQALKTESNSDSESLVEIGGGRCKRSGESSDTRFIRCRGQGRHGQPRRMVLASGERRLFDTGTEEDGHGRRRTEHLSSSRLVSSFRRSSSTTTKRHHRSTRATVEGMLYFCQPSPDYVCP